jgi:pimeloyl-ACP methyl ester carboxylesterase
MTHHYLISSRKVANGKFVAEPGPVRFLKTKVGELPDPSDELRSAAWVEEVRDLADGIADSRIGQAGDVVIYIHGYNNTHETILKRHQYLEEDLAAEGFSGVVVSFDWPAEDSTLNYLEDRWDAAAVATKLVSHGIKLLAGGQEAGCETNVHLLGHSTGAYLIMEACAQADKKGSLFKEDWRIGQVAFIGGDVSSASLAADSSWGGPLFEHALRITNYSNPFDHVLAVSNAKRLGTSPRAGRVGAPERNCHPKVVNVNCGEYFQTLNPKKERFEGTFAHSWHIGNRVFARDLAMTLTSGIDRNVIPTRKVGADGNLHLKDGARPKYSALWADTTGR